MKFPKAQAEFLSAAQVPRKSEAQFFFLPDDDGTSLSTREFQAKCWDSRMSSRLAMPGRNLAARICLIRTAIEKRALLL